MQNSSHGPRNQPAANHGLVRSLPPGAWRGGAARPPWSGRPHQFSERKRRDATGIIPRNAKLPILMTGQSVFNARNPVFPAAMKVDESRFPLRGHRINELCEIRVAGCEHGTFRFGETSLGFAGKRAAVLNPIDSLRVSHGKTGGMGRTGHAEGYTQSARLGVPCQLSPRRGACRTARH